MYYVLGQSEESLGYLTKGLEIVKELQLPGLTCTAMYNVGYCHAWLHHFHEARTFLSGSISLHESLRESHQDEFKLSPDDKTVSQTLYKELIRLLIFQGNQSIDALLVAEQGRARALVDLMSSQYAIQNGANTDRQLTWCDIKSFFLTQESYFLFMTILEAHLCCWFVDKSARVRFWLAPNNMPATQNERISNASIPVEDRSLTTALNTSALYPEKSESENTRNLCLQVDENLRAEESDGPKLISPNMYKNIISPISSLIEGSEIIIIPEGQLFLTPYAALQDDTGKYLSETVQIRLIPSLTTLKLIHDSPANYHCHTGALIVGDPRVGRVDFNGKNVELCPLPKAREETQILSALLGVSSLVGVHAQATKKEILRRIQEVSLVHIAAHGDAERGEIALAPNSSVTGIPKKEDFLLTMKDIAESMCGVGVDGRVF